MSRPPADGDLMRQPEPPDPIEDLREHLRFAIPLRAAELAHKLRSWGHSREQAVLWLTSEARRGGISLGNQGDTLQFTGRAERSRPARDAVARAADGVVTGIAAAALLAQLTGDEGVTVFGDYYGPDRGQMA